ncbi:ABC-F family ATP-binding cassette domain-containing protein [Hyphobacterium marinum]|uniref:ATP-binding cassette domain-containing protein n=1 Tax=Hyphobacterium marinum TaxID=3116574 RepID=A0ABU7LUZ0_9PROT|nr:ATP-binding cassette domain-containing protein [Hyphobacterium sp. Y6023]MEE2565067.1 ATP-binding cassette domain-containing protein [Hyphobacterium sp. Y6023]
MSRPLLTLTGTELTFGATPLLTGADLIVREGERIGLVGRNGSGKSSFLKIAAGLIEADTGERFIHPGATVRYLPQEPDLTGYDSVIAYVRAGLAPGDEDYRADYLVEQLGLDPDAAPATLSGGEARRAALARTLAPQPDILLLDEPTNHLDLPAIEWLEEELASHRGALVLISHDRRFLENLTRAVVWIDRGTTRRLEKGFAHFEAWRDTVFEEEAAERHKLARQIAREEDWMRYGVTARRKRNVRRVGELQDMKSALKTWRGPQGAAQLAVSEAERSGKLVIEARKVSKAYGERPIVTDLSIKIARGDRIALVGPNGAGKTTLVNLLTGALKPDSGEIRLGANLEIASLDQRRAALKPDWTVAEAIAPGGGERIEVAGQVKHVAAYMKDFLFQPEQARTPVHALSGGERARLMLARALALPSNLLVLDEPTNDLDLETLDLLEELIGDYAGTAILVSHDRDFIDRTATATIVWESDGVWQVYAGGYSDMVAQRGSGVRARTGAVPPVAPDKPKSVQPRQKPAQAARMTFKDKHALKTLPGEIEALEQRLAKLAEDLADPDLYARDPAKVDTLGREHARLEAEKAEKEDRWLELEEQRESLEGR